MRNLAEDFAISTERYTNLIIGNGEGAGFLAWHLAQSGQKTAIVDQRGMSDDVADLLRVAGGFAFFGDQATFGITLNPTRARERLDGLIGSASRDAAEERGADMILGRARFAGFMTVDVRVSRNYTRTITADRMILILGSTAGMPNTSGMGLELTGVELDSLGYVLVDQDLETTNPKIYAIGDCAGRPAAHDALLDDLQILWENVGYGSRNPRSELVSLGLDIARMVAQMGQRGRAVQFPELPVHAIP